MYQGLTVSSIVGAPWRCGVLTTWGGIAGIGLGRLLGGEHASTPQSGGGGSSPVKNGASPDCIVVVVVVVCCLCVWLNGYIYYSKRIIMVRWADLSDFFFR